MAFLLILVLLAALALEAWGIHSSFVSIVR